MTEGNNTTSPVLKKRLTLYCGRHNFSTEMHQTGVICLATTMRNDVDHAVCLKGEFLLHTVLSKKTAITAQL